MAFGKKKESREVEGYMKLTPKSALIYLAIIVFCIIVISPLVIVFSSSLRSPGNQASPLMLFSEFTLASYKQAFSNMNYPMELINSILTTGGSVLCVVIFATMAAYPIGRIKTKTAKFLYYFFISGLIIPSQMVIVPIAQQTGYSEYSFYSDDHVYHLFSSVFSIPVFRIYEGCSG